MISGVNVNEFIAGSGVFWSDPPLVSDCVYRKRSGRNVFDGDEILIEGESLVYTVTYATIRDSYDRKYRRRTSGWMTMWDTFDRNKFIKNNELIRQEDNYLEFS
ncbi:MAG: hypothetical protein HC836_39395 [Richelia sp. RM2_1_2]|nr:hypothetical protein [Richelia sp. RM2_1_2]